MNSEIRRLDSTTITLVRPPCCPCSASTMLASREQERTNSTRPPDGALLFGTHPRTQQLSKAHLVRAESAIDRQRRGMPVSTSVNSAPVVPRNSKNRLAFSNGGANHQPATRLPPTGNFAEDLTKASKLWLNSAPCNACYPSGILASWQLSRSS
jgi:hypothetical protein